MKLKVEYLNTENIKNPTITYKVTGKHNDIPRHYGVTKSFR